MPPGGILYRVRFISYPSGSKDAVVLAKVVAFCHLLHQGDQVLHVPGHPDPLGLARSFYA